MLCRYTAAAAAAAVAIPREKCVSAKRGHPERQRWRNRTALGARGVPLPREASFLLFHPPPLPVYARFPYPPPTPPPRHRPGRVILMRTRTCNPTEPNGGRGGTLILRLTMFSILQCTRYNNVILSGWLFQSRAQHYIIIIL